MESHEMTKILVIFTTPGTSGGVFTGLCFQLLRVHVYRAQNWCVKPWNDENSVYVYNCTRKQILTTFNVVFNHEGFQGNAVE